jgi:hypothetical protein
VPFCLPRNRDEPTHGRTGDGCGNLLQPLRLRPPVPDARHRRTVPITYWLRRKAGSGSALFINLRSAAKRRGNRSGHGPNLRGRRGRADRRSGGPSSYGRGPRGRPSSSSGRRAPTAVPAISLSQSPRTIVAYLSTCCSDLVCNRLDTHSQLPFGTLVRKEIRQ